MNEDVRAQKDALENLNTQENIKKDSFSFFLGFGQNAPEIIP